MAVLSIKENDFDIVASAANEAYDRGDHEEAEALDVLARKINAALTRERLSGIDKATGVHQTIKWKEMPSCLLHNIQKEREND